MEDYKKKYEQALDAAKKLWGQAAKDEMAKYESIFPELKGDEDERTRNEIIEFLVCVRNRGIIINIENWGECDCSKWICWLEKQEKAGWSEKDIKMIDSIIEEVRPVGECPDYPTDDDREYYYKGQDRVDWLERLKKSHIAKWMPSKSQLQSLSNIVRQYNKQGYPIETLTSLLNDFLNVFNYNIND